jgi:hypothetical protein
MLTITQEHEYIRFFAHLTLKEWRLDEIKPAA